MPASPAIEARGLVKRYGEKTALAGIDLDVPRGAVCALLGPNGAGKTTAVRILTTLTVPDEGTATVAGRDVLREAVEVRRSIGLAAPDILFLDEPTTGLDPRARNELWGVLDDLVADGATVLLTTQYLEEADRLADDIVVIDHGRVIARGDARSLKRDIGGDQLHVVVRDPADLPAAAELVGRAAGAAAVIDAGERSAVAPSDGGVEAIAELAGALSEAGIEVDDLGLRQPTLDDVFLTLTGAPTEDGAGEVEVPRETTEAVR